MKPEEFKIFIKFAIFSQLLHKEEAGGGVKKCFAGNTEQQCNKRHTSMKLSVQVIVFSCSVGARNQVQRTENDYSRSHFTNILCVLLPDGYDEVIQTDLL